MFDSYHTIEPWKRASWLTTRVGDILGGWGVGYLLVLDGIKLQSWKYLAEALYNLPGSELSRDIVIYVTVHLVVT
jgi:hypothetical protein